MVKLAYVKGYMGTSCSTGIGFWLWSLKCGGWIAGVRLLLKMGWRHGRVIGPKHIAAAPGKTYN